MICWLIISTIALTFYAASQFWKGNNEIYISSVWFVLPPMIWAIVKLWGV